MRHGGTQSHVGKNVLDVWKLSHRDTEQVQTTRFVAEEGRK